MKVEVEIPEGKYCDKDDQPDCPLRIGDRCPFLPTNTRLMEGDYSDGCPYLKHPDCPSLKETTK